ncbi:MAG: hypothetical protein ABIJ59_09850 [Pseudomonadota bacterium]
MRVKLSWSISECVRVIEIESQASFLDLHEAIQDAVDFDNDHLFEFYIGRNPRNREYPVGGEPNWDTFNPMKTYRNIKLSSTWPLPKGMNLYYLFDFGDNWLFQVNKTRHKDKEPQPGVVYPRVIEAKGKNPEQYPDYEEWDD